MTWCDPAVKLPLRGERVQFVLKDDGSCRAYRGLFRTRHALKPFQSDDCRFFKVREVAKWRPEAGCQG